MEIKRIEGATRELSTPIDWDEELSGHCATLPIRDAITPDGRHWMISAWEPSEAEIKAILRGESIKLWIEGKNHPVVAMSVFNDNEN